MKLSTYASRSIPECFVTLPAATAASTIGVVDRLGALQLVLFKAAYGLPEALCDSPFVVAMMSQIVDQGYALHGREALPERTAVSRAPAARLASGGPAKSRCDRPSRHRS